VTGTEIRCVAGQTDYPSDCTRHSSHHWCEACAGYFGIPHYEHKVWRCHSGIVMHDPKTWERPSGHCACTFCRTVALIGFEAAYTAFRTSALTPEPEGIR
jgi:hypothetical protein